jgi:two-component system, NtrC family, response regulator HydG
MPANILILDDEESILFSFHRFLVAVGYRVTVADSYEKALTKLNEDTFDLILADIILGDGCGINILREVQRRKLHTRVVIMTAYPSKETEETSFHLNAMDYLIKPLRQERLLSTVKHVLGNLIGAVKTVTTGPPVVGGILPNLP